MKQISKTYLNILLFLWTAEKCSLWFLNLCGKYMQIRRTTISLKVIQCIISLFQTHYLKL